MDSVSERTIQAVSQSRIYHIALLESASSLAPQSEDIFLERHAFFAQKGLDFS